MRSWVQHGPAHTTATSGKVALVATGHAIALIPGVLAATLRADVTTLALVNPPTRGIYALLPPRDPHPSAPLLLQQITELIRAEAARRAVGSA